MENKIGSISDFADGQGKLFTVQGINVAVFKVGDKFYAVGSACTHAGGPLDEGKVSGTIVECPWHGSKFDLKTGSVMQGPAQNPVKNYEIMVKGEEVFLQI